VDPLSIEGQNKSFEATEADLEKWKEEANAQIKPYLNREFREPIESILTILKRKIEETKT